jgi:predicted ribosome quality control (RQC) complex YloA/Tae2 family protein
MARFQGLSPFLADELAARAAGTSYVEAWREIFGAASGGEWIPVVIRGDDHRPVGAYPFPTIQAHAADQHARDSINMALDHYFSAALPRAALDSAKHALSTEIDRGLKARLKKSESLRRSAAESGRAEEYKQSGELILANIHAIQEGVDSAAVSDFFAAGEPQRVIALDPTLTASENAEAYFRRYRKAKDSAAAQIEYLEAVEADIVRLREAAESARSAASVEEVKEIRRGLVESGALRESAASETPEKKASRFQGKKIRAITTPEGWELLYGENSEANDYLTAKVASPNDLWLHVRASPSSHVVIRTRNEPGKVPQSVIKRAALVAAQHSASKHSATVPVDYTLKKYVRRPRGGAPGTVLYQNEKTIHVSPKER